MSFIQTIISWLNPAKAPDKITISIANLEKAFQLAGKISWPDILTAIKTNNWEEDAVYAEDVLKIIGVFFPPAAVIESDAEIIVDAVELLISLNMLFNGGKNTIPQVTQDWDAYRQQRWGVRSVKPKAKK